MWREIEGERGRAAGEAVADATRSRRAYYRVHGLLPIRLTRVPPHELEAAIFDLSLPDPLLQPVHDESDDGVLMERMRRIEEKLDLLLGASDVNVPRRLSGRDRRPVVFSGSGLALEVDHPARAGDAFKVEILLPPPYGRTLRAVARTVRDAEPERPAGCLRPLALALDHMEDDERDALVAYSYDLQRHALRVRGQTAGRPAGLG